MERVEPVHAIAIAFADCLAGLDLLNGHVGMLGFIGRAGPWLAEERFEERLGAAALQHFAGLHRATFCRIAQQAGKHSKNSNAVISTASRLAASLSAGVAFCFHRLPCMPTPTGILLS